jgi:hypothetical protein
LGNYSERTPASLAGAGRGLREAGAVRIPLFLRKKLIHRRRGAEDFAPPFS